MDGTDHDHDSGPTDEVGVDGSSTNATTTATVAKSEVVSSSGVFGIEDFELWHWLSSGKFLHLLFACVLLKM